MTATTGSSPAARRVLLLAIDAHRDDPATARLLHGQLVRLDEPLRVAIAGKVKAGKSTLLNALVGEQVAPTDAGECTRVVTWYRGRADARGSCCTPRDGPPSPLPVRRRDGALVIDLGGTPAERVDRLDRGLAVAEPAADHPDRHPGHRVADRRELAAHRGASSTRTTTRPPRPTR